MCYSSQPADPDHTHTPAAQPHDEVMALRRLTHSTRCRSAKPKPWHADALEHRLDRRTVPLVVDVP
jgi:hypothetical protein